MAKRESVTFLASRVRHLARSARVRGLVLAVALGLVVAMDGSTFGSVREPNTRGFLIIRSAPAIHFSATLKEDCPDGFERTTEESFQATLPPAERARLLRPENAKEYAQGWKEDFITGPGDTTICRHPRSFLNDPRHPPYRGVQSKVAYGLNLDGTTDGRPTRKSCAHPKFVGPNGEAAIDNQLYRATGCSKNWRGADESVQFDVNVASKRHTFNPYLIELRGLDDLRNDDDVEVGVYSIDIAEPRGVYADSLLSQGGADFTDLPYQSFRVTPNPEWRTRLKGRMVDGVLTTDAVDVMYMQWRADVFGLLSLGDARDHAIASEFEFRGARFQLSIQPDGTIKGILGAYVPLSQQRYYISKDIATINAVDCASEYKTWVAMADGYPDPATGQCTRISSAYHVAGPPAFVIHQPSESQSASGAKGK